MISDGNKLVPGTQIKTIKINHLTRVEGEGALYVRIRDQEIEAIELNIFEAPRYFEALLRGRSYTEVPDITARICGICPVAYQMSSVHALEQAFKLEVPPHIQRLRRLLYAGEWIESHCLHIFLLHAPDFLGFPDAVALASQHRPQLERGLRLKKLGNSILSALGGREIHPINVKVGGFYRLPPAVKLQALLPEIKWALSGAAEALSWVSGFAFPDLELDYELVSLSHADEYPMNQGQISSNRGLKIEADEYEGTFLEQQVAHSTALHYQFRRGGAYLTGPLARFRLNFARLRPELQDQAEKLSLVSRGVNPYRSIQIRLIEVMQCLYEAQDIIQSYDERLAPSIPVQPFAAEGFWATEAPRGLLYHRYRSDEAGRIVEAKIVAPTSQNQKLIEEDLRHVIALNLETSAEQMGLLCEKRIRNYDPCISCSTHFLRLNLDRGPR